MNVITKIKAATFELLYFLRLGYDPIRDKDDIPVIKNKPNERTGPTRTATTKTNGTHQDSTGKKYAKNTIVDEYGNEVPEFDSTDVKTETNVPQGLTKYDYFVFQKYKDQKAYKFFDLNKYRVIKERAFSKAQDGEPISYRSAAKLPAIKSLKGCGERRCSDYYKAMNEAQEMYINKAPIPSEVMEVV